VKAPKVKEKPAKGKKEKRARTETDPIPEPVGDPPLEKSAENPEQ